MPALCAGAMIAFGTAPVAAAKKAPPAHAAPAKSHKAAGKPPAAKVEAPPAPPVVQDLSKAIPESEATKLPPTAEQYRTLTHEIEKTKPAVASAKQKSDALMAQTARLRRKLIESASRVQQLEADKARLDAEIAGLSAKERSLSLSFARDRVAVARLLAVLERLEHDTPPVIAIRADDALSTARGSMVLGASLPRVYGAAAARPRPRGALGKTRAELFAKRAQGLENANDLRAARTELDQLLAMKEQEAEVAAGEYGDLRSRLAAAADQARDLKTLLEKVALLRAGPQSSGMVVVSAAEDPAVSLKRDSLIRPVVGRAVQGGVEGVGGAAAPGINFVTEAGAAVVAPADSKILFAGPYHKSGQVLILEMAGGYDLVLAGLGQSDVRPGDQVLAGEPLGTMPRNVGVPRLYFEVRRDGKGVSPAPWLQIDLRKAKRS